MCSLIIDGIWKVRNWECSCMFLVFKLITVYDVVSDFLYWNSVKDDDRVPELWTHLVLTFACIGFIIDACGSCFVCTKSSGGIYCINPNSKIRERQEKLEMLDYTSGQHGLSIVRVVLEDLPQLFLSSWITAFFQREMTTFFVCTAIGSILNMVRVIAVGMAYLCCKDKFLRVENMARESVRKKCDKYCC